MLASHLKDRLPKISNGAGNNLAENSVMIANRQKEGCVFDIDIATMEGLLCTCLSRATFKVKDEA